MNSFYSEKENIIGGGIALLTNNPDSVELFEWLVGVESLVYLISDKITIAMIEEVNPNMLVSYNYRHIISEDVLTFMGGRAINLHISLLPWNRGAAPNIFSFLESTPCGVTIHQMAAGIDTGDILMQEEISFDFEKETLKSSYEKLHCLIQRLFKDNWQAIKRDEIVPKKQIGEYTYHRTADLEKYRDIIDYDDTIAAFLKKAAHMKT